MTFKRVLLGGLLSLIFVNFAIADAITWPTVVIGAAVSRKGVVAITQPSAQQIVLYPKLTSDSSYADSISTPCGKDPVAIIHKQIGGKGYFAILCKGDSSLYVYDDATGKLVKKIAMQQQPFLALHACYSEKSPWAYYTYGPAAGAGVPGIGRVDLEKLVDEGDVAVTEKERYAIAPSADGRMLYATRLNVSPTGFMCFEVMNDPTSGKPVATRLMYSHTDGDTFFIDPAGQMVANRNLLYNRKLDGVVSELPGNVVAFSAAKPFVFVLSRGAVTAISTNTFKPAGTVVLKPVRSNGRPDDKKHPSPAYDNLPPRYLVDDVNGVVVCYNSLELQLLKFADFKLPDESTLLVEVAGPRELVIDQPWTAKLVPKDPATKIELETGPEGLTLKDNTLFWTPKSSQTGTAFVRLTLKVKDASRGQDVPLMVRRPSLALPFTPQELKISSDGKLALVANLGPPRPAESPGRADRSTRLVLIDLTSLKILAERQLDQPLNGVALDSDGVFVALRDSPAFMQLSLKDLTDVKRVFTKFPSNGIVSAGSRIFLNGRNNPGTEQVFPYSKPDLEPIALGPNDVNSGEWTHVKPVGDGWAWQGNVWDANFQSLQLLGGTFLIPKLADRPQPDDRQFRDSVMPYGPWGMLNNGGRIQRNSGQPIGRFDPDSLTVLLTDIPAAVVLEMPDRQRWGDGARRVARLVVKDLILGQNSAPYVLSDEPRGTGNIDYTAQIDSAKGVIVAQAFGRLYVLPTSTFASLNLPVPLFIEPKQSAILIDPEKPTVLTYSIKGGKPPLTYSLVTELPGVTIDTKTGAITIDPKPLLAGLPDRILQEQRYNSRLGIDPKNGMRIDPAATIKRIREQLGPEFKSLTGKDAAGIAVSIPIGINARDSEQQTAKLTHAVLIDAPVAILQDRLQADANKAHAHQAEMDVQRKEIMARAATQPSRTGDIGELERLRAQMLELQRRNAALEAKVELLTDLLERQRTGGAPATQTSH